MPSMLWCTWLGDRKGIWPVKTLHQKDLAIVVDINGWGPGCSSLSQCHLPVNTTEGATGLPMFAWKMAVIMVCVCYMHIVLHNREQSGNTVWDLSKWHILKWHDTICQLTCRYANAVNVRLCVVATQVLHSTTFEEWMQHNYCRKHVATANLLQLIQPIRHTGTTKITQANVWLKKY